MSIDRLLGTMRSGGSTHTRHITSRCRPSQSGKTLLRRNPMHAGSRDDVVALPGTAYNWSQQAQEACGRLERSRSLHLQDALAHCADCHALEVFRRRMLGQRATQLRLAESSPKTACLGNGWQGARRAGSLTRTGRSSLQLAARPADLADRIVVRTSPPGSHAV